MVIIMVLFSHREPKLDWANDMALPVRFSSLTTKAIETGILTKSARVEIVHSLSTLILMHTSRPTPHDMDTISRRLVAKYPKLWDTVDSGYVRKRMYNCVSHL